nr:MAG: capsid protein [Picornaviridae sp.]
MKINSIANTFLYSYQADVCPSCLEFMSDCECLDVTPGCPECGQARYRCYCFDDWDYVPCTMNNQSMPIWNEGDCRNCYESLTKCWCGLKMKKQSEPIVEPVGDGSEEAEQTTHFTDESSGMHVDLYETHDAVSDHDQLNAASLKDFLSRPARIDSFTWLESDSTDLIKRTINPWHLFFNDARIKYKLNNFAFIRCKLKVKILVNASPFYYGCMGVAYQPLQTLTPSTIYTGSGQQMLMPFSQRPISWLYPQESQGAEMSLPFLYHKNWLDINVANDFIDMGQLDFITYTDLQSANGVAGQGVAVQVYAWAEDVELSGATVGLSLQSQPVDEYGTGPVSAPATTVATIASKMKALPVIGKFMTATEIGARAVAGIASLFGFTNVPVIENVVPYKPCAFPALASTEISFPNEKLTLDPKNELTIDPTVVGAPGEDPLAIQALVTRESFLVRFTWDTTNAVDDLLFYSRVNPWMFRLSSNVTNSLADMTPMGMVSRMFEDWRGDIIFRFKIIASPYHKGRVIVAFDPSADATTNLVNTVNSTTAVYTQIIDIGEDKDVELRVPYVQALPFLRTAVTTAATPPQPFNTAYVPYKTNTFSYNVVKGLDNGCITMRVLTNLTAPVASAPVRVLVSVRGADNLQFANPKPLPQFAVSNFQIQSQPVMCLQSEATAEEGQKRLTFGKEGALALPNQFRVNFGEIVSSVRVLLHRANYIYSQGDPTATPTAGVNYYSVFGKLPPVAGYDLNGIQLAVSTVSVGNKPYNWVQTTPVQWVLPCFVGYRGSGVWTLNANCNTSSTEVSITRDPSQGMQWSDYIGGTTATSKSYVAYIGATRTPSAGGTALTQQITQAGLSVLCPNYNNYKFNSTAPANMTKPPSLSTPRTYDGAINDTFQMRVSNLSGAQLTRIDKYWHAGPDFQPIFFLNVPSMYLQNSIPTPV